jgi:hypothetical protein
LLTVIFLWLSWVMAGATKKLTNWIVGKNPANQGYGEGGIIGPKYSPYLLPKTENGEGTPSKDIRFDLGRSKTARWLERCVVGFSNDLRWRLGLAFLVMWVGNVTYR